jgi:hypothetical protein
MNGLYNCHGSIPEKEQKLQLKQVMFSVVAEAEERFKYRASNMIDCNHRMSTYKTD